MLSATQGRARRTPHSTHRHSMYPGIRPDGRASTPASPIASQPPLTIVLEPESPSRALALGILLQALSDEERVTTTGDVLSDETQRPPRQLPGRLPLAPVH